MDPNRRPSNDPQFDVALARVLRAGVLLAAGLVACGGAVFLARHGLERPAYEVFRGEARPFRTVYGIIAAARDLSGRGFVQLGILLLIGTPIARVVFSIIGFARQRDWLYVGVTGIVLVLLAYSLLGSP